MQNNNFALTIIISLIILIAWHFFYQLPRERQYQQYVQEQQTLQEKLNEAVAQAPIEVEKAREEIIADTTIKRLPIKTNTLSGSISLKGARLDDLTLLKYRQELDKKSKNVTLLSPAGTKNIYFSEFGWLSSNKSIKTPDRNTVWQTNDTSLGVNETINLYWNNQQGQKFTISITLDKNYMFNINQKVINTSNEPISLIPYGKLQRAYTSEDSRLNIVHEGLLGVMDGILNEVTYSEIQEDRKITYQNTNGWLGITDKYWQTAIVPDKNYKSDITFQYYTIGNSNRYQADYRLPTISIDANDAVSISHQLFAGAKEVNILEAYTEKYNIPLFDRSVDFGALYFLTKPIFHALHYLFIAFGNFGIAILGLTIVIKLLLFPLANKQYRAFAKMRKLAPEINDIKDRLKDDRMQMNQEIMALYKRERVNPMSGCLPVLIQLPVFFALYKVLNITIEMRHAPFYGWIKDLSAPDPTSIFNLFGLLDWQPTGLLMIGALPILMCITMYVQYALNPKANDPMQEKIMKWLPIIFMFILSGFPAGLIIYWTWSNILSITQQYIITRITLKEDN